MFQLSGDSRAAVSSPALPVFTARAASVSDASSTTLTTSRNHSEPCHEPAKTARSTRRNPSTPASLSAPSAMTRPYAALSSLSGLRDCMRSAVLIVVRPVITVVPVIGVLDAARRCD